MNPVPTSAPGPLDPTVLDALRGTALGPLLDRPVNSILQDMGLPQLPDLPPAPPLPELPPLPLIDLAALTRPLTDLASSFGTGQLGDTGGQDPIQALSGVASALQQAMTLATSIMQLASSLWQGAGATGAAEKGTAAASDAAELQAQGAQQKTVLAGAAGTVATGAASMAAIITKYITALAASAPFLVTPPGQIFVLTLTTETAAEATAVVAKTRAELTGHSASMTAAGEKVKVTNAPQGVDPMQHVSQLLGLVQPLMGMATTGAQTVKQLHDISQPTTQPEDEPRTTDTESAGLATPEAMGGPVGAVAGLGAAGAGTQLSQWSGARAAAGTTPSAPAAVTESTTPATRTVGTGGTGMVPMGAGAGLAARAGDADSGDHEVRTQLVTSEHGDAVVGELGNTATPVVGAVGTQTPHVER
ncbi:hypothetical protein [Nocardia otitidiscaviarum]|uniref:hypothetical protein n=1 Tax=Nocardia otitidiscaviarum TaxID=1823 RepID=UPI0024551CCC|nr:hypothetical protein [Nocardia otitidiscaviarum]